MKLKTITLIICIAVVVYFYFTDRFLTINIHDTYFMISYFYLGVLVALLIGLCYLLFKKKKTYIE